jgi:acyl-CoA reductase-like NAD-dependent aldehyde dehydrogenase
VGRLFVQESIWDDFVSRLRVRIDHLRVGDAFDRLADVGSPLSKRIVADLAAATAVAQKNGLEVYRKDVKLLYCLIKWIFLLLLLERPNLFAICNNTFSKWWEG